MSKILHSLERQALYTGMSARMSTARLSQALDENTAHARKRLYGTQAVLTLLIYGGVIFGSVLICELLRNRLTDSMDTDADSEHVSAEQAFLKSLGAPVQIAVNALITDRDAQQAIRKSTNLARPCREQVRPIDEPSFLNGLFALVRVRDDCGDTTLGNFETSLFNMLSPERFQFVQVLFLTVSCVLAGLGSEFFIGRYMVQRSDVSVRFIDNYWKFAQTLFPAFVGVGLYSCGSGSPAGLILVIAGLWKAGMPETLMLYVDSAEKWEHRQYFLALNSFMEGLALLIHHSISVYVAAALALRIHVVNRFIMSISMILLIQHWFCITKYLSHAIYALSLLSLEFWFELEVLANVEILALQVPWMAPAGLIMLFPHQMWLQFALYRALYDAYFGVPQGETSAVNHTWSDEDPNVSHRRKFSSSMGGKKQTKIERFDEHGEELPPIVIHFGDDGTQHPARSFCKSSKSSGGSQSSLDSHKSSTCTSTKSYGSDERRSRYNYESYRSTTSSNETVDGGRDYYSSGQRKPPRKQTTAEMWRKKHVSPTRDQRSGPQKQWQKSVRRIRAVQALSEVSAGHRGKQQRTTHQAIKYLIENSRGDEIPALPSAAESIIGAVLDTQTNASQSQFSSGVNACLDTRNSSQLQSLASTVKPASTGEFRGESRSLDDSLKTEFSSSRLLAGTNLTGTSEDSGFQTRNQASMSHSHSRSLMSGQNTDDQDTEGRQAQELFQVTNRTLPPGSFLESPVEVVTSSTVKVPCSGAEEVRDVASTGRRSKIAPCEVVEPNISEINASLQAQKSANSAANRVRNSVSHEGPICFTKFKKPEKISEKRRGINAAHLIDAELKALDEICEC